MGAASSQEYFPALREEAADTEASDQHRVHSAHSPRRPGPGSNRAGTASGNALGLTGAELADVRRVHCLLARDATKHCVNMHIK